MSGNLLDSQLTAMVSRGPRTTEEWRRAFAPPWGNTAPFLKTPSKSVGARATQGRALCSCLCSLHPDTQSSSLLPWRPGV